MTLGLRSTVRAKEIRMRRLLVTFLSAVVFAHAAATLLPASPASAAGACAGVGTMTVTPGLLSPVVTSPAPLGVTVTGSTVAAFMMTLFPGTCVHEPGGTTPNVNASGLVSGWCGLTSGTGTLNGGRFSWIGVGGLMVMTGDMTGVATMTPGPGQNESCGMPSGATSFIVAGAGLTLHCVKTFPHNGSLLLTIPIPTTLGLPLPFVHTHTHPWHIWVKTCLYTPIL
jgi:hypothetical protein